MSETMEISKMSNTKNKPEAQRPQDISNFLESVPCPSCDKDQPKVIFESRYPQKVTQDQLLAIYKSSSDITLMDRLVECKNCGLQYLSPRIRADIILESYKGAEDTVFTTQNEERIATFKRSMQWVLKQTGKSASKETRVLDVGCAGGAFPKAAHDLGCSVIGVEPSRFLATNAAKMYNLDIRPGTLDEQKFPDNSFDVVTLWDVLEHLTAPRDVLAEIHRILKPGGILVVNYPDGQSWAAKILGRKWPFYLSVHLIYFGPKTVKEFLAGSSFQVLKLRPFWQTLKLGYILTRATAYFSAFKVFQSAISAIGLANMPVRYNVGQSIVLARKA